MARSEGRARSAGQAREAREAPPADVTLGADFVARLVPELPERVLKAYIGLARVAPTRTYHEPADLHRAIGLPGGVADLEETLVDLEQRGLIEIVRRRGERHCHFLNRDPEGVHRASAVRPSIKEALQYQRAMVQELLEVATQDETPELRERHFERYPQLRDEYELARESADKGGPPWRLWMELSLCLMSRFEERYGVLKVEHAEVFKETSAQLLRLQLELVEGITREVLARKHKVFPEVGAGYVVGLPESEFTALPLVRDLSRRYRVGAETIYLSTIEALEQDGHAVVEVDDQGNLTDLLLPSTTGLEPDEERLVFLHIEEFTASEVERFEETLGRIRAAKQKYVRHLLRRGVETLMVFVRRDRVADLDAALQIVADRVNEAIDVIREEGEDPRVAVPPLTTDDVLALYRSLGRAAEAKSRD